MHRFYCPNISEINAKTDELIILDGNEAHHALNVLRLGIGDALILLNGRGEEFLCKCDHIKKNKLALKVIEYKKNPPQDTQIVLIQSIPKGRLIEYIIEKSIELGSNRIVPLITKRVVPNWGDSDKTKRIDRWHQIIIGAIKQCGQTYLPQIDEPTKLEDFLAKNEKFEMNLVCALTGETSHPRAHFDEFRKKYHRNPRSICIWIGPEGDFTPEELTAIKSSGALPITLGKLVLRVETAALCALSIINYELNWAERKFNQI
ncbi:MAG: RsmE family RNA methyltransferase [Verrucomicrobiia bacterium]|jgi:16S rRNA (uracil1498-N3)-methyltransferase